MNRIQVAKTTTAEIQHLRILFLQENNIQFVHNKCHLYGWADTYKFILDDTVIGYGAVWGQSNREDRDAIFEFFVIRPNRNLTIDCFAEFRKASEAIYVECQSNDPLLCSLLYRYCRQIAAEAILFEDTAVTSLVKAGSTIRAQNEISDNHKNDLRYVLFQGSESVATGGMMLNYNMPFADLYMEVHDQYRKQGYGSLIIQELKKECYRMGRVPAARCNINNNASRATLEKAGFSICGYILKGVLIDFSSVE